MDVMPRFLIAILVLALGYYPVLYVITWWTKDEVITELVTAAKKDKLDTLEAYIDWDKLRTNLKHDLKNRAESIRQARSVPAFGPPPDKIDGLVEHYVTPKGIEMAFAIHDMRYPDTSPRAFIADSDVDGPSSFSVTLALPEKIEGEKGPGLSKGQRRLANRFMRVRFVFERQGWRWRAREMHVPIFLVPPEAYTIAQVKDKLDKVEP
jgi:hypothetical protein